MQEKTFVIKTFGCKVNQCESSFMVEELVRHGYRLAKPEESASICIVHGCAVTSRASYEARQALYQFHRRYPYAYAFVFAGCAAHYEGKEIAEKQLATHILGNMEKLEIASFLEKKASSERPIVAISSLRDHPLKPLKSLNYSHMMMDRSRAFIKIQDGCDNFCSYCIVPYTRGSKRSLPAEDVASQIRQMVSAGYNEVVLTGIHLGQWGQDFSPSKTLIDLLKFLEQSKNLPPRLRLSSLEPSECTQELLHFLRDKEWFCPHFHVPLQSGDPEIIKLMGRNYDPTFYEEVIDSIRSAFPNAAIGADVIVGFPGEREDMFENTFRLVEKLSLTYLHVFPYSSRKGTLASRLNGKLPRHEIQRRAQALRELGLIKKKAFMTSQISRDLTAVLERAVEENLWYSTSENYLPIMVFTDGRVLSKGSLVRVYVTEYDADRNVLVGRLIQDEKL